MLGRESVPVREVPVVVRPVGVNTELPADGRPMVGELPGERLGETTGELRDGVRTLDEWRETEAAGSPSRDDLEDLVDLIREDGEEGYWSWHLERLEDRAGAADGRPTKSRVAVGLLRLLPLSLKHRINMKLRSYLRS